MARPVVLVATTNAVMAQALQARLAETCHDLGFKLDVCPGGDEVVDLGGHLEPAGCGETRVRHYCCAESLFDYLESRAPMELADTLVVLDVGASLEEAFKPSVKDGQHQWHRTRTSRSGVAVELILRFPQVFPVILSPAVPTAIADPVGTSTVDVCEPQPRSFYSARSDDWKGFHALVKDLCMEYDPDFDCTPGLMALQVPLHFVSPLDGGRGLGSTLARFARGMRCWFDPTGLRTLMKNRFLRTVFGADNDWDNTAAQRSVLLHRLDSVAVAIDEEREFAMLNAYAAYKHGRRAWMVTTFAEFDKVPLWTALDGRNNPEDVVVIRDIDLRFPDIPDYDPAERDGKVALRESLKSVRRNIWRRKCDDKERLLPEWRVRVVSSHPKIVDAGKKKAQQWAAENKRLGETCDVEYLGLSKPVGSIYTLKSLLCEELTSIDRVESVQAKLPCVDDKAKGGHGAPYLNLAIAESLLQQSRRCEDGPVENLIGALLAGEAYELLLGMSKTTALEALLLVHKKEVTAEVEFPGVSHDIRIDKRRGDIEKTLNTLYNSDESEKKGTNTREKKTKRRSTNDVKDMFLSQFWAELRSLYKDGEQFVAAESANSESLVHSQWTSGRLSEQIIAAARKIAGNLKRPSERKSMLVKCLSSEDCVHGWILKFKRWLLGPATSLWSWLLWMAATTILSATFYAAAWGYQFSFVGVETYFNILFQTVLGSIGLQFSELGVITKPAVPSVWQYMVMLLHLGVSYLLFGLLVSMLYRKVTRG